jgi:DNA-binding CsgD family transcriptional regulator
VLLARGDAREAAAVAAAGAAAADAQCAPLAAGRCRTLGAEALVAAGQTTKARTQARRAAAELGACGAWGYRDAALRVLRRLGDRPRPSTPGPHPPAGPGGASGAGPGRQTAAHPGAGTGLHATPNVGPSLDRRAVDERLRTLTAREREVAALLGAGETNAQIAHRLHLSESTVEKPVSRVLAKLGMSTRTGVAALLASRAVPTP